MQLSKNLTLAEATKSQVATRLGIKNVPNQVQTRNLQLIAQHVFQPVRDHFDVAIAVTSGFRSLALNKAIGGSKTSEHMEGRALDLDGDVFGGVTNKEIFDFIKNNLDFNQLIWEFGDKDNPDWVHVSYKEGSNKRQVLRAKMHKGRAVYSPF
jgi:zinc D-Ala-D-Ala carboxypeptidase